MKLFLDDIRNPPDDSWKLVRTPFEFIKILEDNFCNIVEVSLDHDLGEGLYIGYTGNSAMSTGYYVVMEMISKNLIPPKVNIHSMNPAGSQKMLDALKNLTEVTRILY